MAQAVSGKRANGRTHLLWLIDSLTVGGAERLVATFANELDTDLFDLTVVCLKEIDGNPLAGKLEAAGVRVVLLHARNLRDVRAFLRLRRLIREERIDLIHAHLTYAEIWARLAGWLSGRPVVSTIHVASFASLAAPGWRARTREGLAGIVRKRFGGPVIAVSDALRDHLVSRGLRRERVTTIHNGVDLSVFALPPTFPRAARRREFGIAEGAPVVITLAVLRDGKGHDLLIDAAQRVIARRPETQFLVVGGGPLEKALRSRVDREGLGKNIHLTGMREDAPEMLALADMFVLPSSQFDALPTAIIEAMASGLPVIAFDTGGVPEIVIDGETGLIVPQPDADGLAGAICELLANPAKARAMAERGRARALAEFSARTWVHRLQALYTQLIGAPVRKAPQIGEVSPAVPKRKLRIAVVEFLGRGGILHYAYQLCTGLAAQDAEVELLTARDYELEALAHTFTVRPIFRMWDPRPQGSVEWSTSVQARLARLARRTLRAAIHYREWFRLIRVVRRERPDVVQFGEIRFASDLLPLLVLRASGVRLADVCHNIAPFDTSADASKITKESRFHRAAFRRIYACFDVIFVHSESNRREFARLYGGDNNRIQVIPHGNERMFVMADRRPGEAGALIRQLGLAARAPTALFFGTLTKYKGVEYLIDAFAEVKRTIPEAQLVVAGFPNPEVDVAELRQRTIQLGIADSVKLHMEYVPVDDVAELFEAADVVVFPYLMIYQSGALQVAYSFGKPVVATDVGGLSEAVIPGETGWLVPPRDSLALANAIGGLLRDREKARRMGERGRELSETAYSWEGIARDVRQVYDRF